jgi:ribulose kinase
VNIRLHIDRLVLDGLHLSRHQSALVRAAVEHELDKLLVEGGLSPQLATGGSLAAITGGSIQATHQSRPSVLGTKIAAAVYSGIGEPR